MSNFNRQSGFTLIEVLIALILAGIAATAIVTVVVKSGGSANTSATISEQNAKLRNALQIIKTHLTDADRPINTFGWDNSASANGSTPAYGSEAVFTRTEENNQYLAIRFKHQNPSNTDTGAPANTITMQIKTKTSAFTVGELSDWTTCAATTCRYKVLADKIVPPTVTGANGYKPLFAYYKNANESIKPTDPSHTPSLASTGWGPDVGLVDVTILRDEDGPTRNKYTPAKLTTSVFLQQFERTQGSGDGGNPIC